LAVRPQNADSDARSHLASLVGQEIKTLTGRSNRVLRIEGDDVVVATARSPNGQPVPIAWVQNALDLLERDGEVVIDVETVGYRSAFIGAVSATLPCTSTALAPSHSRAYGLNSVTCPAGIAAIDFAHPEVEARVWAGSWIDSELTGKRPEARSGLKVAALVNDERRDQRPSGLVFEHVDLAKEGCHCRAVEIKPYQAGPGHLVCEFAVRDRPTSLGDLVKSSRDPIAGRLLSLVA
jgi:hypothetical protein